MQGLSPPTHYQRPAWSKEECLAQTVLLTRSGPLCPPLIPITIVLQAGLWQAWAKCTILLWGRIYHQWFSKENSGAWFAVETAILGHFKRWRWFLQTCPGALNTSTALSWPCPGPVEAKSAGGQTRPVSYTAGFQATALIPPPAACAQQNVMWSQLCSSYPCMARSAEGS